MRLRNIIMTSIILLMLVSVIIPANAETDAVIGTDTGAAVDTSDEETQLVDDIEPEENIIGPDHVLYKLRMAFEDLDVAFTFNDDEKVSKQVSLARHRLAEVKSALIKKNQKAAESAIEQYQLETEQAEETVSRLTDGDKGLIRAQERIANHSYVLERLLELHSNPGLLRAYNNSQNLLEKFAMKTNIRFESTIDKMGRKVMRHIKMDDGWEDVEKTTIKASVEDNKTNVRIELKFLTNSTTNVSIASDILDRIDAIEGNVSDLIKIEHDDEDELEDVNGGATRTLTASTLKVSREKIRAQAEVRGNTSKVVFEYQFFLNKTDDSAIINGVEEKLSALTQEKILDALEVRVRELKVVTGIKRIEDRPKMRTTVDRPEIETTDDMQDDKRGRPVKINSRMDD